SDDGRHAFRSARGVGGRPDHRRPRRPRAARAEPTGLGARRRYTLSGAGSAGAGAAAPALLDCGAAWPVKSQAHLRIRILLVMHKISTALIALALASLTAFGPSRADAQSGAAGASDSDLAPISVSGSYWIELSPVVVAANSFYPERMEVGEGGITRITAGEVDLATNAETQLLRESLANPDLRIIMTVTESFYRLVGRRSAGIETLADLRGKRVMLPRRTSANYYLVAMLETVGLTEEDVELVPLPQAADVKASLDLMSDALLSGEVDVISIW